jgi:hypothetical protein
MRHQALRCVLSEKARTGKLVLVEGLNVSEARTKEMIGLLQSLGATRSTLIVTREPDMNVVRSAHNIDKVWTLPVRLLNAYELLKRDGIIMSVEAVEEAQALWQSESPRHRSRLVAEDASESEPVDEAEFDEEPASAEEAAPAEESAPEDSTPEAEAPGTDEAVDSEDEGEE